MAVNSTQPVRVGFAPSPQVGATSTPDNTISIRPFVYKDIYIPEILLAQITDDEIKRKIETCRDMTKITQLIEAPGYEDFDKLSFTIERFFRD